MFWVYILLLISLLCCVVSLYLVTKKGLPFITPNKSQEPSKDPPVKHIANQIKLAEEDVRSLTYNQLYVLAETYHYGKYGKEVNLGRAVKLYEASRKQGTVDVQHVGRCHMALGRLYKDGGANTDYVPDARKAIHQYLKALASGHEEAIIEIGNIYSNGLHPNYLPDRLMAGKIFGAFSRDLRCSNALRETCHQRAMEISSLGYIDIDNIPEYGRQYYSLPQSILEDMNASIETARVFTKYQPVVHNIVSLNNGPQFNKDIDIQIALWNDAQVQRVATKRAAEILDVLPEQVIHSDSQNVHSSTVQNAAINKLKAIESNTNSNIISNDFEANKKAFMSTLSSSENNDIDVNINNIERVLSSLNEGKHSRYGKSEIDVFNIVWSRVNDPINADRKQDMINILAQNISSGVEHDAVVCSTGKIVRMIGSLDVIDAQPLPELKPEWAINEEIASAAAQIRNKVLENSTTDERSAYEAASPTDVQKEIAQKLSNKMQEDLKQKCIGDYCDSGLMTRSALDSKLTDYLENM